MSKVSHLVAQRGRSGHTHRHATRQAFTLVELLIVVSIMGKSSLIVKLRHRIRNKRHRARFFMYAVDVRAARGPQYVLRAVLQCLNEARKCGCGSGEGDLSIADMNDPLESPSLKAY